MPMSTVVRTKVSGAGGGARVHRLCGIVNKSSLTDVPDFRNLDKVENVLQLFPPSMDPRRTSPSLPKPIAHPVYSSKKKIFSISKSDENLSQARPASVVLKRNCRLAAFAMIQPCPLGRNDISMTGC